MSTLCIDHAGLRLKLDPERGAALVSLQSCHGGRWQEWLAGEALAARIAVPACFPLIPFANRIANGALQHTPQILGVNRPDLSTHPIHGYAWQGPWNVDRLQPQAVQLSYDGDADAWPWEYRAVMQLWLSPGEVRMHLKLTHLGLGQMPAGLGWHPAFPSAGLLSVQADTEAFLAIDDSGLPVSYVPGAAECAALARGEIPAKGMDSDFDGWHHRLRVQWSDRVLELSADPIFTGLHVFRPVDTPLICLEPVSHLTGAMARQRLPELASVHLLGTGESLQGGLVLRLLEPLH